MRFSDLVQLLATLVLAVGIGFTAWNTYRTNENTEIVRINTDSIDMSTSELTDSFTTLEDAIRENTIELGKGAASDEASQTSDTVPVEDATATTTIPVDSVSTTQPATTTTTRTTSTTTPDTTTTTAATTTTTAPQTTTTTTTPRTTTTERTTTSRATTTTQLAEPMVRIARGGPGPRQVEAGHGVACGQNSPLCLFVNVEMRDFEPGQYSVHCTHDGWLNFGPETWWTFEITVDASGNASRNGPCFINFAKLSGDRGVRLIVSRGGTEIARSNWLN